MTRDGKYDTKVLRGAMLKAKARFDERKIPFKMETIPGHMVHILEEAFPGEMEFTHERNDDEYVYEKDKLITLSGRALHKKKNHLNYFQKTYDFEVKPIEEGMFGEIMVGAGATYACTAVVKGTNPYAVAGVYTGAMTSSPGLASALETAEGQATEQADAYETASNHDKQIVLDVLSLDDKYKDLTVENTSKLTADEKQAYVNQATGQVGIGHDHQLAD